MLLLYFKSLYYLVQHFHVILNKYGKQNEILWNLLGQFSQKMIARTISETNLWDMGKKAMHSNLFSF